MADSLPDWNVTTRHLDALKNDVDTFFLAIFGAVVFCE